MSFKERLVFDPANATEGDKIAGYVYGAGGTLITSTTVGPDEGLDVNILNTVTVSATNLDIRDLTHVSDSVKVGDGTDFLLVNTDGSINITDNGGSLTVDGTVAATQSGSWTVAATQSGSWTVTATATDFDIRDLTHVSDSIRLGDGTTLVTTTTVGPDTGLDVNILNDISVSLNGVYDVGTNPTPDNAGLIAHTRAATPGAANQTLRSTGASPSADNVDPANVYALDTNAFGFAWDGSAWDRLTSTSGNLNVNVASSATLTVSDAALANTAVSAAAASITTTAASVATSALSNRKYLFVQNLGNRSIYVGPTGVTTATGLRLSPGSVLEARIGAAVTLFGITDSGTQDVRSLQAS